MSGGHTASDGRRGAWRTLVRGLRLSPELFEGLTVTLLIALVATAGRAVVPVAVQLTIDHGLGGGSGVDVATTVRLVLGAAVGVAVTAAAAAVMNARVVRVTENALSSLRVRGLRHLHDLSILHIAGEQRGSLTARVTSDIDEISRFMQHAGLNLITSSGQMLVATAVMLFYSWRLTLVVLVTFVPFALVTRRFQLRLSELYTRVRDRVGDLLGAVAESVVGADVVRAYGIEERTRGRIDEAVDRHLDAAVRAGRTSALFSGTSELVDALATSGVVLVGVLLGVGGGLSTGRVIAFLFLVNLLVQPVRHAAESLNELQTAVAGWRRVLDLLDATPDVADPPDGVALPPGAVGVRFEKVTFRYPRTERLPGAHAPPSRTEDGPEVLHDVDVAVAPGSSVAVVGETGSGKTTFAKLMVRLMDPTSGRVLLGDVPLDTVRFASLRERVLLVPQEGMLLGGTIADNVRLGRPGLDDAGVEAAFAQLGLDDWLSSLPDGVGTAVGERGAGLSAGEQQLVALVRAFVADPDLLVLDEATSSVDPATEARLRSALAGLRRDRTTVAIAHRLSTAEEADEVLVFDDGRLVQRGAHRDLVRRPGVYRDLHASWVRDRVSGAQGR